MKYSKQVNHTAKVIGKMAGAAGAAAADGVEATVNAAEASWNHFKVEHVPVIKKEAKVATMATGRFLWALGALAHQSAVTMVKATVDSYNAKR